MSSRSSAPLVGAVTLALLILASAVVWRFYGRQILAFFKPHEVIKSAVFQPVIGPLADRAKFAVTTDAGTGFISTTLPVSVTAQKIDFGQGVMPVPQLPATAFQAAISNTLGTDADAPPTPLVPVKSAWLVKFSNAQLCNANGACPLSLVTESDDDRLIQGVIFNTTAHNVWVSSHHTNGNPDILVDYGIKGQAPVRLAWQTDGEFPTYGVADASATVPHAR